MQSTIPLAIVYISIVILAVYYVVFIFCLPLHGAAIQYLNQ